MRLAPRNARGNSLVTINDGVRFICSPSRNLICRCGLVCSLPSRQPVLGSTAASAGLVTVTSYDMNNGNGAAQLRRPELFRLDIQETGKGAANNGREQIDPLEQCGAERCGSRRAKLRARAHRPLNGRYHSECLLVPALPCVGWKYQDPNIMFHLAAGHDRSNCAVRRRTTLYSR